MADFIKSIIAVYREEGCFLGGPKHIDFAVNPKICVSIEQLGTRSITISSDIPKTVEELYAVLTKVERLLVLFDGHFYQLEKLELISSDTTPIRTEYLRSISANLLHSRLHYYSSADIFKNSIMSLVNFDDVLNTQVYSEWDKLLSELDTVNQMYLYASSECGLTKDVTCAFFIELSEPLVEIVKISKNLFKNLSPGNKRTTLRDCIDGLVRQYGDVIFEKELKANYDQFLKAAVNSRVKIMHIKRQFQKKICFDGKEAALYEIKFSLLYRRIIFYLLNISENLYINNLKNAIREYDKWNNILDDFLVKIK